MGLGEGFKGGGPAFDEWRSTVAAAVADVPSILEAIASFGFEATGDQRYLRGRVTRYYIYALPALNLEDSCRPLDDLVSKLFRNSRAAERAFRIVIADTDVTLRDVPGSSSLYLKTVNASGRLLETYSTYLALMSPLIVSGTLLEAAAFCSAASARRYVYQLTIIAASLYEQQCGLSTTEVDTLRGLIRQTPDRDPQTGAPALVPADSSDLVLLNDLILPMHSAVARFLNSGPRRRAYRVMDIHSGLAHQVTASEPYVETCQRLAATRYLEYPSLGLARADEEGVRWTQGS